MAYDLPNTIAVGDRRDIEPIMENFTSLESEVSAHDDDITSLQASVASLNGANLQAESVANAALADGAVDTEELADGAVTSAKLDGTDSAWKTTGITAATGWSISTQSYRRIGDLVYLRIGLTRTGAAVTSSSQYGTISPNELVATMPSGYRPPTQFATDAFGGYPVAASFVDTDGGIKLTNGVMTPTWTSGSYDVIPNGATISISGSFPVT